MPELPEVESIRRSLNRRLPGARVVAVRVERPSVLDTQQCLGSRSNALLKGATIQQLLRHGKQLAVVAEDGRVVVVHLGMSGQLVVERANSVVPDNHRHVTWTLGLRDGATAKWVFRDPRRFGGVTALPDPDALRTQWARLGPDALLASEQRLADSLRHRRSGLKSLLLDQSCLAGVGNIYADEALFRARLHPQSRACDLTPRRLAELVDVLQAVLRAAVASRGSSLRDYRDGEGAQGGFQFSHQVYGRAGEACVRCASPLDVGIVAGRTTVWCPVCQR